MRSDREDIPEGYTKADADKAETMEATLATERTEIGLLAAPGCQVYWPAPYEVCGAIRDKYNSMGGPNSFLLWPKTNELTNPDGVGKRTEFQNGPIYWSPQGGAHPVVNHFLAAWARQGYETRYIGYPTTDEIINPDGIGRRQHFTGATIYWHLNEGYSIGGAIADKWHERGAERTTGLLGYPTSDEKVLPDGLGRMNTFEWGEIYWHPTTGAHPVTGLTLPVWKLTGSEAGAMGYPVGPQSTNAQYEVVQPFQNGEVNLTQLMNAAGTVEVDGKPINKLLYDALQAAGSGSIGGSASRQVGPTADTSDGGIPVPPGYTYDPSLGDLNDYCSSAPDSYRVAPGVGLEASFKGPCARHDMCYERNTYENGEHFRPGYVSCNRQLQRDLQTVCTNVYTAADVRRWDCIGLAHLYYDVVVAVHPTEWDEHIESA